MAVVREIFWRKVTDADFVCVERDTAHGPRGGGGQTYFSVSFGEHLDKEAFGVFLEVTPPSAIDRERPDVAIEAAVLTDPGVSERIEFKPRYQTGPDDRYRIARQNRQRARQSRHPAWRSERGFPVAPDDIAEPDDPRMPDLSFLKLVIVHCVDGTYFADYVNADVLPAGAPPALAVLFEPNADVPPDGLIHLGEAGLDSRDLAVIVASSRARPLQAQLTSPEIDDARDATARLAGARSRRGQGFRQSAEQRTAIDRYAMRAATDHLEAAGWDVTDRSVDHPYDLFCARAGERVHVEVKGTTSDGSAVLLTPNEVAHARAAYPETALLIVHGVSLAIDEEGEWFASGGDIKLILPWEIDAGGSLHSTGYSYELD